MRSAHILTFSATRTRDESTILPLLIGLASMFFFPRVLATTRLFSTSAVAQFPKLKSHSGAKKRWRSIASGIFKRVRTIVV